MHLDSCISLGANSSYSASKEDQVFLEGGDEGPDLNSARESVSDLASPSVAVERPTEYIIELQVKCLFIPD